MNVIGSLVDILPEQSTHIAVLEGADKFGLNKCDPEIIELLVQGVHERGAVPEVIAAKSKGEPGRPLMPEEFLYALRACDVFVNCTYDITWEEFRDLKDEGNARGVTVCRNFLNTVELLKTPWAHTSYKLLSEIRYQATKPFGTGGQKYTLKSSDGTDISGRILPPQKKKNGENTVVEYAMYRTEQSGGYRPFPEWICPPISIGDTEGVVVFSKTHNWWADYLGIDCNFTEPAVATIEKGMVKAVKGGKEAGVIWSFMKSLEPFYGEEAFRFRAFHVGVNPVAQETAEMLRNKRLKRLVDHTDTGTVHVHICELPRCEQFPYRVHLTADLNDADLCIGDEYIVRKGHMAALDSEPVRDLAQKEGFEF